VTDAKATPPGRGPLGVKASDITDGTSKVIMVGEREYNGLAATWVGTGNAGGFDPKDNGAILVRAFNQNWDLYGLYVSTGGPENRGKGPSSPHPNGVQYLFADGAVVFVSDAVTFTVLGQLFNRCDRYPKVVDVSRY